MKFLSNISILSKFLLLPALAAVCMLALTIVYVSARHSEDALISQIIYQDVPKMRELSRQFSEFSTNHVKFISLLTASLKGKAGEGQLYVHGRNSIIAVNKAISALGNLDASFELNAQQRQIAESLRHKLIRYRDRMSEAVLLASVQAHLVAQVTLDTNQTYDAANKEFLLFIDTVEQDANGSIAGMRATLHTNQINFIIIIAATLIFMVLFSVMLAILFTSDIKSTITLLTRLAHGDMAIVKQVSGRKDEFRGLDEVIDAFREALIRRNEAEGVLKDEIQDRTRIQDSLRISEERFRILYDENPLMLLTTDKVGNVLSINRRGISQIGYSADEVIGRPMYGLVVEEDRARAVSAIKRCTLYTGTKHQWTLRKVHKNGDIIWLRETGQVIGDGAGSVLLLACEDITETRKLTEKLSYQAAHDDLTGLVNRREFERRLARALEGSKKSQAEHVLCYLDLDQFKIVNDTCGHAAGDHLLKQVSKAMEGHIRNRDTLGRLGGDEFGVLLEGCSLADGWRATKSLLKAIEEFRFAWNGREFRIGASVGVVLVNDLSGSVAEILANADGACYTAKEQGRNRIHVHSEDDQELKHRRGEMEWANYIPHALESGRFELYCQPIVPINGAQAGGLHGEFLIRMRDEEGKLIMPGLFLPAAERYSLVTQIDRWVVTTAFTHIRQAQLQGRDIELCAINLSGNSLGNEDFLEFLLSEIKRTEVNPLNICFEVTETAAIANLDNARKFMARLKQEGVRFSLDDFGTGLSSFAYLRELPVDFLKIDGVFIKEIVNDPILLAMVRSINEIGHVMGMQTIAEFVETQEILDKLRQIEVDYAQGYHIGRPRPAADVLHGSAV